ncbi:MAG: lamin tail domain-containing protein [Prevotella sp.]|nr:lamin tail domain-containing protein [Prevotella sp.]
MLSSTLFGAILIINEIMASNLGTAMSPATNFDSWIEIYNPGDEAVDLGGMYLSDDAANPTLWHMPKDMGSVPAKGFKVVWIGSNNIKTTQAPFKLDCDGGAIYLSDKNGQLVTSEEYPEAMSRTAWARQTDGTGEWGWTADATPGKTNATAEFANQRLEAPVVSMDSKVFTNAFSFQVTIPEGATLAYTTDGSLPQRPKQGQATNDWTNYVVNGDCEGDDVTCLVGKDGNEHGEFNTKIIDGVGYNGTRGVKVHAVANPSEDWSTQFFVYTPDHVWNANEKFRFKMKVRADKATHISAQAHSTPGSYITWQMLDNGYNVGTEWQEIVYEGTISQEQSGSGGGWWGGGASTLQTIAFNLNEMRGSENNFYFDDISWESYQGDGTPSSNISKDGKFTVSNTTNYCFRLFQDGYLPSVPVTRSYIKTNDKYTIPVVSIVGDKRYFSDNKWGIDTDGTNGRTGNGQSQPRNYNMDWERPVNFSFITPDGVMPINQDVEISVSGGWTRSANPRSFKLKSGKEFDGQNSLDYVFFPQKPYLRNKVILLRNGGNDVWENGGARFMDPALQTIIQRAGINLDLQSYVPVIEYVNGQFKGLLNMREPNNKKFVESNWGYDDEHIDMFEMSADSNVVFMVGNSEVLKRIYELGEAAPDPAAYEELKQILDIDEFINYMAIELFLGSNDWPHNNIKGFRSQDNGRYRFVTFDLDYSFKYDNPFAEFAKDQWHTFNLIFDTQEQRYEEIKLVTFFLNMLKNEEFRKKFIDTYCLVGGSVFETERGTAIVNELADRVRPMMQLDGWRSPDGSANIIKSQLKTRNASVTSHMKEFKPMQLSNVKKQQVTLSTNTQGGSLYINGLEVPYAYFNGYLFAPVQIEAKAPAGHVFAGWKKGSGRNYFSTEPVISLPNDDKLVLTAYFTPMTEDERQEQGITPVRINEVSAANNVYVNEYWKRNDWVELYNTTDQAIDVEGMYLTDNLDKPHKYQIQKGETEANTVIPPHGHLIIWCDKLSPVSQLHASFKLDADGGDMMLSAADDSWSDVFTYPMHQEDETVGRYPDGCNTVQVMNYPTIEQTNITSSYAVNVEQPYSTGIETTTLLADNDLTARYVLGRLIVRSKQSGDVHVELYNLAGQSVGQLNARLQGGYAEVPVNHLSDGCYIARVTDESGRSKSCKFVMK